ncbi:hypothetical protein ES702_07165 [subsurface metagenome]
MELQHKEAIKLKIIKQQRDAYELAKYLRSTIDLPIVSYVINTYVTFKNGKYEPVTVVKQLPEIRVHHGASDEDEEFMKLTDIDNVGE